LNVLDRSNYFKGLLILAIKDNVIAEEEEKLLMDVGSKLGFEKNFCHNAIQQSLGNEYLVQTPPVFSNKDIAELFLLDGLKLAVSDNNLDPYELQWLDSVAKANNIEKSWLSKKLEEYIHSDDKHNIYSSLPNIKEFETMDTAVENANHGLT